MDVLGVSLIALAVGVAVGAAVAAARRRTTAQAPTATLDLLEARLEAQSAEIRRLADAASSATRSAISCGRGWRAPAARSTSSPCGSGSGARRTTRAAR